MKRINFGAEHHELKPIDADAQASECCDLLGVVSWHEKGFWQVDVFNTAESDEVPVWFATGKKGSEQNDVAEKAFARFGNELNVVLGFWGECEECGDEVEKPQEFCGCGGQINGYA